jgi:hypothetical protein
MKKKHYLLSGVMALLLFVACSEEDRYPTSIVRNYEFFLNESSWVPNVNQTGRPIFIYGSDGKYVANYLPYYNFALNNGTYRFFATPNGTVLIPDSLLGINLNDLIIKQPLAANTDVQISPVVNYSSPFNETLQLYMANRT